MPGRRLRHTLNISDALSGIMVLDPSMLALIQDPITLAVVSGFAGGCVEPLVSHGIDWVSDRYRGHPKDANRTCSEQCC